MNNFFLIQEESLTRVADAIREKSNSNILLTFPDGMILQLENIGAKIVQGSVTFEEEVGYYVFLENKPDIFILYLAETKLINQTNYVFNVIQLSKEEVYTTGYNKGTAQYCVGFKGQAIEMGTFSSNDFNTKLGPYTYNYIGIYI